MTATVRRGNPAPGVVRPGDTVSLDMEVAVPNDTGQAKFAWSLNGTEVVAGTAIQVVAP